MQPAVGGELRGGEDFAQTLDFGLGGRDDKHVVAVGDRVELVLDAANIAAEPLDRFDRQMAVDAGRPRLDFGRRANRKPAALGQHSGHRVQFRRLFDAVQIVSCLPPSAARVRGARASYGRAGDRSDGQSLTSGRRQPPGDFCRPFDRPPHWDAHANGSPAAPSPQSAPAFPCSAAWPPQTSGAIRSRRRTARSAQAAANPAQTGPECRPDARTRPATQLPLSLENLARPATAAAPQYRSALLCAVRGSPQQWPRGRATVGAGPGWK